MIWLWLQSLVLLTAIFSLGLWLGHMLSQMTVGRQAVPHSASFLLDEQAEAPVEPPAPVYHGAEPVPEPLPAVAEPLPVPPPPRLEPVPVPAPRVRAAMLFPINQFGVITVTQAPA